MDINYLGHSSFKIKGKTATIITDPYDSALVGLKFPAISADIVTVSHEHADHNAISSVSDIKKVVSGPGEYEIQGVSIVGLASYHDKKKGEERGLNTIYVIEMDKIRLVHLGDLGDKLTQSQIDEISDIDVAFVPVGGEFTINAKEASDLVFAINPKIIIPMHYKRQGMNEENFGKLENVSSFLTETGLKVETLEKLSVKKEDLVDEQKIVIFDRQ